MAFFLHRFFLKKMEARFGMDTEIALIGCKFFMAFFCEVTKLFVYCGKTL